MEAAADGLCLRQTSCNPPPFFMFLPHLSPDACRAFPSCHTVRSLPAKGAWCDFANHTVRMQRLQYDSHYSWCMHCALEFAHKTRRAPVLGLSRFWPFSRDSWGLRWCRTRGDASGAFLPKSGARKNNFGHRGLVAGGGGGALFAIRNTGPGGAPPAPDPTVSLCYASWFISLAR